MRRSKRGMVGVGDLGTSASRLPLSASCCVGNLHTHTSCHGMPSNGAKSWFSMLSAIDFLEDYKSAS